MTKKEKVFTPAAPILSEEKELITEPDKEKVLEEEEAICENEATTVNETMSELPDDKASLDEITTAVEELKLN